MKPACLTTLLLSIDFIYSIYPNSTSCLCLVLIDDAQDRLCNTVILTSTVDGAYDIKEEIIVSRRVTVMGNPSTMPTIDAAAASRAFRVKV